MKARQSQRLAYLASTLICVLTVPRAYADSEDTFNLNASYSLLTDSNVFRLSESAAAPSGSDTKSDQIRKSTLGLSIDKSYSLQRLIVNINVADFRYSNFDYLSFSAVNYAATWQWSLTPKVHGKLSTEKSTALNSYTDFQNVNVRNLRTISATSFDAEAELAAAWRVTASLEQSRQTNDVSVVQEGDVSLNGGSIGLRYVAPSKSYLAYRVRRSSGDYFNRVANVSSAIPTSLDEFEQELRTVWFATGKSVVTAKISHLSREHPGFAVRDYSGTVGSVTLDWGISGKLALATTLSRDLSPYQTDTSSYMVADKISIAPLWKITAHTSLRANYQYASQDYRGGLPGSTSTTERHDNVRTVLVGMDWRPRETISLSLSLQNTKRLSNTTGFDYKVNAATVAAQVSF